MTENIEDITVYGATTSGAQWTSETVFKNDFVIDLNRTGCLLVLDAMSFPWEVFEKHLNRVVVYICTPSVLSGEDVVITFKDIFSKLTFFDRVYLSRADHIPLVEACSLHSGQWSVAEEDEDIVGLVLSDYCARNTVPNPKIFSRHNSEPTEYWLSRGAEIGSASPELAVCSVRHSLAKNKIMHREQMHFLLPILNNLRPNRDGWNIVEFGCGVGRVLSELQSLGADVSGFDLSSELLEVCSRNLPNSSFRQANIAEPIAVEDSRFDVALFVTVLHHLNRSGKLNALRSAIQSLRIGGYLVMLEDFVANPEIQNPITIPIGINDLQTLVARAGRGGMVYETVRSFRYSHVLGTRTAVIAMKRVL